MKINIKKGVKMMTPRKDEVKKTPKNDTQKNVQNT